MSIGFNHDQPIFIIISMISIRVEGGLVCNIIILGFNNINSTSFFLGSVDSFVSVSLYSEDSAKSQYLKELKPNKFEQYSTNVNLVRLDIALC